MSEPDIPLFWSHLSRQLSIDTKGLATPWLAPVARIVAPDGFDEHFWLDAVPDTVIAIRLGGSQVVRKRGVCAGKTSAQGDNFALQPRGTPNWFTADGECVFGHILLPDALIDRASDSVGQGKLSDRLRPDLIFCNERGLSLSAGKYMERALTEREPPTCLEMEGRAILLLDALLGVHGLATTPSRASGGLCAWQLRRVCEFVDAHLDRDLALDDLAGLINLSGKHFSRAFRQSTGVPPHRWLIERRIDRARSLILNSNLSLAAISLACGFADQSHFTATFRRLTGVTPKAYRRLMRV